MFKQLLICFLAIQLTTQTCAKGCLACDTASKCTLCDFTKNYYLANDTCTMVTSVTNCSSYNLGAGSLQGKCLSCDGTTFLNQSQNTCVSVTATVANCANWDTATTCNSCTSGFVLVGAACKAVTTVANCSAYSNETVCSACASTYLLNTTTNKCDAVTAAPVANCAGYSPVRCDQCAANFFFNPNLSYQTTVVQNLTAAYASTVSQNVGTFIPSICQAVNDENCTARTDAKTCTSCSSDYYLNVVAKNCNANPKILILQCLVYASETVCAECEQGYYVLNSKCSAVTAVPNCSVYNSLNGTNKGKCTKCVDTHYLTGVFACQARVKSALHQGECTLLTVNADTCSVAKATTVYYSSAVLVNNAVDVNVLYPDLDANCDRSSTSNYTFQLNQSTGTTVVTTTCSACVAGYYRVTTNSVTTCVQGDVSTDHCLTFQQSPAAANSAAAKCTSCAQGYHLVSLACVANKVELNVAECNVQNTVTPNTCNVCNAGFFRALVGKNCLVQSVTTPFCTSYKLDIGTSTTEYQCLVCSAGKKLSAESVNNTCVDIPISGCNVVKDLINAQNCLECSGNQRLLGATNTFACRNLPNVMTQSCAVISAQTATQSANKWLNQSCLACQQNYVPMELTDQYQCLSTSDYAVLDATAASANCSHFQWATTVYKCIQCASGFGLDSNSDNSCIALNFTSLQTECKTVILFNDDGSQNLCNTQQRNEERLTLGSAGTADAIVKCTGATLPVYLAPFAVVYHNLNASNQIMDLFTQTPSPKSCETISAGDQQPANSTHCEYWVLDATTKYNCLRCAAGFTQDGSVAAACTQQIDSQCSVDSYAPASWQARTNCTKCSNNKTPYLLVSGATKVLTKNLLDATLSKDLTHADWTGSATKSKHAGCLSNFTTDLNLTNSPVAAANTDATTTQIPANCGLVVIDTALTKAIGGAAAEQIRCAYCQNGYKATMYTGGSALQSLFVKKCSPILNCNVGIPNGCKSCNTGFAFNGALDNTQCVQTTGNTAVPLNCISYNPATPTCTVCERGFQVDQDGNCHKFQIEMCDGFNNSILDTSISGSNKLANLYLTQGLTGCSRCQSGYVGVQSRSVAGDKIFGLQQCVQSIEFLATLTAVNVTGDPSPKYVPDCKYYAGNTGNAAYQCHTCNSGFVLTADRFKCVQQTNDQGCTQFTDGGVGCNTCQNDKTVSSPFYALTNSTPNSCQVVAITNCVMGNTGTTSSTALCTRCAAGFYLNGAKDQCLVSAVANCLVGQDGEEARCTMCQPGFKLTGGWLQSVNSNTANNQTTTRSYCYPIVTNLGCDNGQTISTANNVLAVECTVCDLPANRLQTVTFNATTPFVQDQVCTGYSSIANCSTYQVDVSTADVQDKLSTNFMCSQCASEYYIDGVIDQKCTARTSPFTANCKIRHMYKDECVTCESGQYLNSANKQCIKQPDGKKGCLSWETSVVAGTNGNTSTASAPYCVTCDTTQYTYDQANKTCVDQKNPVSFCAVVLATQSEVVQVAASGNTAASTVTRYISDCQTCAYGYLKTAQTAPTAADDWNRNNCVVVTVQDKAFCATYSSLTSCATCNPKYKLQAIGTTSNQKCVVDTTYNQCSSVDVSGTCTSCKGRYFLDNGTPRKCTQQATTVITNCSQYSSLTACMTCVDGFYLNAAKTACVADVTGWDANCSVQLAPTTDKVCSACMPGYTLAVNNGVYSCVALTGNQAPSSGCLFGNAQDSTKCLICMTEYHMNSTQACSSDVVTPPTTTGVSVVKAMLSFCAVLLMMF